MCLPLSIDLLGPTNDNAHSHSHKSISHRKSTLSTFDTHETHTLHSPGTHRDTHRVIAGLKSTLGPTDALLLTVKTPTSVNNPATRTLHRTRSNNAQTAPNRPTDEPDNRQSPRLTVRTTHCWRADVPLSRPGAAVASLPAAVTAAAAVVVTV